MSFDAEANPAQNGAAHDEGDFGGRRSTSLPLEDIDRLVQKVGESGIGEIHVRQGDFEVVVKAKISPPAPPGQDTRLEVRAAPEPATGTGLEIAIHPVSGKEDLHTVRSPIVGTFYSAPAPGEAPFVKVGEHVREGQTLSIVEAMKLMNEIPSDASGEVVEVLVENGDGVQYDQPLFRLRIGT